MKEAADRSLKWWSAANEVMSPPPLSAPNYHLTHHLTVFLGKLVWPLCCHMFHSFKAWDDVWFFCIDRNCISLTDFSRFNYIKKHTHISSMSNVVSKSSAQVTLDSDLYYKYYIPVQFGACACACVRVWATENWHLTQFSKESKSNGEDNKSRIG